MNPSLADYQVGSRSAYPHLWSECVFALAPGIGYTGGKIWDYAGGSFAIPTAYDNSRWIPNWASVGIAEGSYCIPSFGFTEGTNGSCYFPNASFDLNCVSVSLWVWNNGQGSANAVFSIGSTGLALRLLNNTTGTFTANWSNSTSQQTSATSATIGAWTHLTLQRQRGNGNRVELWVNGAMEASASTSLSYASPSTALNIGARRDGASTVATWGGSIDDMRIYQRMLRDDEIKTLASQRCIAYVPSRGHRKFFLRADEAAAQSLSPPVITVAADVTAPNIASSTTLAVPVASVMTAVLGPTLDGSQSLATGVASVTVTAAPPDLVSTSVLPIGSITVTAAVTPPAVGSAVTLTVPVATVTTTVTAPGAATVLTVPVIQVVVGYPIPSWSSAQADQMVWQDQDGAIWAGIVPVQIIFPQTVAVPTATVAATVSPPAFATVVEPGVATVNTTVTDVTVVQAEAAPVATVAVSVTPPAVVAGGTALQAAIAVVAASVSPPAVAASQVTLTVPVAVAAALVTAPALAQTSGLTPGVPTVVTSVTPPVVVQPGATVTALFVANRETWTMTANRVNTLLVCNVDPVSLTTRARRAPYGSGVQTE